VNKYKSTNHGSEQPIPSTVYAFAIYQRPEDDKSLKHDDFMRRCPNCRGPFDVRLISKYFVVDTIGGKTKMFFYQCPNCVKELSSLKEDQLRRRFSNALRNVETSEDPCEWAVTTDIAVWSHAGDEVAALVYGCLLSSKAIKDYSEGSIDLVCMAYVCN